MNRLNAIVDIASIEYLKKKGYTHQEACEIVWPKSKYTFNNFISKLKAHFKHYVNVK